MGQFYPVAAARPVNVTMPVEEHVAPERRLREGLRRARLLRRADGGDAPRVWTISNVATKRIDPAMPALPVPLFAPLMEAERGDRKAVIRQRKPRARDCGVETEMLASAPISTRA
jgi:hypothetical protein